MVHYVQIVIISTEVCNKNVLYKLLCNNIIVKKCESDQNCKKITEELRAYF